MRSFGKLILPYLAAFCSILGPVLAMPYIALTVGAEGWGIISLGLLIGIFALIVEQGVSQALSKEAALWGGVRPSSLMRLLKQLRAVYFVSGLVLGVIALAIAALLYAGKSEQWSYSLTSSMALVALTIPVQMLNSFGRAFMLGRELHQENAIFLITSSIFKHGGGVLVAARFGTPQAYFFWLLLVGVGELILRQYFIDITIEAKQPKNSVVSFSDNELMGVLRRCLVMGGAVMIGSLAVYLDRYLVGIYLPLNQLGVYTIASTAAVGSIQVIYPLCQAAFPKIAMAKKFTEERRIVNIRLFKNILFVVFLASTVYMLIGDFLLGVWLIEPSLKREVGGLLDYLLVGSAMNAFFNVGYLNWVADSSHRKVIFVYGASLVVMGALTPMFIADFGLAGASICWVSLNFICLICSLGWVFRR